MSDASPYCPNDNFERRHSTCVKHKLNNKDSFSHNYFNNFNYEHKISRITLCQPYHIMKQ